MLFFGSSTQSFSFSIIIFADYENDTLKFFWKTCVILCFLCNISLRNERTFKKQTIYVQCLGILRMHALKRDIL
jgi:hypothetical protein